MKMKFFLLTLLLGASSITSAYTQNNATVLPLDPESKKIMYREVVNQEGNPGYLYDKAVQWFGYYYQNAQSIFSVQDRTNGKVEGVGRMKIYYNDSKTGTRMDGGLIMYTIRFDFKENKYRYTLTDFNLKAASRFPIEKWLNKEDPAYNPNWDSYIYQIDTTMQRLISTLKEKMKPTVLKKDEW
jgi:hypothetical protein